MKLLIFICALISYTTGNAIEKWHKSADGSRFYIEPEKKFNWYEAWNDCTRKNMSLIAIDTFEKHLQIDALIKKVYPAYPEFWLAGHDNAIDLRYEWVTTGEFFSFTNWGPNQPGRSNNNEHCILIWHDWNWHDLPCTYNKLGFICEENRHVKELEALRKECQDKSDDRHEVHNKYLRTDFNSVWAAIQKWHKSNDGSNYYIEQEQKYNWYQAWNECQQKDMSLITIGTFYKHQQIDPLIRSFNAKCPSFWVAAHDMAVDLRYEWATTGEVFTFTNWRSAEPNRIGNNEHCILIWEHFFWCDLPCTHKLGFICEEHRFLKEISKDFEQSKKTSEYGVNELMKFRKILMFVNSMQYGIKWK